MKRLSKSRNDAQLRSYVVVKGKSDTVKNNMHRNWNVRSMKQGKLEVVKQEIARVTSTF